LNVYSGNGNASSTTPPLPSGTGDNFGVGLAGTSKDNLIEKNKIGGNVNGVYIGPSTQGGNVIRRNIITGNPPVQVSETFGSHVGADIQDLSPSGANSFEENYCLTYSGAGPAPCPNLSRPEGEKQR
jgi:parallel beta-helix repeat protein